MCGKRSCIERNERTSTEPSPTPASNTRTAGGRGWMLPSSSATRLATTHFSEQVLTNSRYFCRLSKKRKRSEEHTSELQSRPHLVCRLLLEKKNQPLKSRC